jgi:predicted acyl esterase
VRYFQPWTGTYATAPAWPVGAPVQYYLSGGNALVLKKQAVVAGSASFLNPGFTGSSYSETSAVQSTPPISGITPSDTPGTYASFLSQPLAAPLDVVGVPAVTVTLSGAVPAGTSPETDPVVFAKLYDVTTDGAKVLVDDLVAPVRVGTAGPVTITLPGIVHRYDAGDRLDLVFAATDLAYLGNRAPETYTISGAGPLTLPVG